MPPRYIVITPARNEESLLPLTIRSMEAQTVRPVLWVIVDDGSSDGTGRIIDAAAQRLSWIRALHRPDRGFRKSGGGVIEAFTDGYRLLGSQPWDFLAKFDGDLSFDPDYFERCLGLFEKEPSLGLGGGAICVPTMAGLTVETPGDPAFHVRGATKIYRRACWEAIGGLVQATGWDTIDEVKASMLGWHTRTFRDIRLVQNRGTGKAESSWKDWVKNGRANYMTGYHPLFMLLKCVKRSVRRPCLKVAAGLWWGFMSGYLGRHPRAADAEVVRYVRGEQMKKLSFQPSLWG